MKRLNNSLRVVNNYCLARSSLKSSSQQQFYQGAIACLCTTNNNISIRQGTTTLSINSLLNSHQTFNFHTRNINLSEHKSSTTTVQSNNTIQHVSDYMKRKLTSCVKPDYIPQIDEAVKHFEKLDFSSSLKSLQQLNESVFNEEKNFFTEAMQNIRMIYQYVNFMEQTYSQVDGVHQIPLFSSILTEDAVNNDYVKYEEATKELENLIKSSPQNTAEMVTTRRKLAWIKFHQNYLLNGINDLKEALSIARNIHGKTSVEACYCYADLATFYVCSDNVSAAEKCAKIVISLLSNKHDKTPYMEEKIAMSMCALSESLRETNQEESIKINTSAIKIIEKIYGRRNKKWIDCIYTLITNYDSIAADMKDKNSNNNEFIQKGNTLFQLVGDLLDKNAFTNTLLLPLRQSTVDEDSYEDDLLLKMYRRRKYPLPLATHALFGAARVVLSGEEPEKSIDLYEKALFYLSKEYAEDEFLIEKEFACSQLACIYALMNKNEKGEALLTACIGRIGKALGTDNRFYQDIASYEALMGVNPNNVGEGLGIPGLDALMGQNGGKSTDDIRKELEKFGFDVDSLTSMMEQTLKSGGGKNMNEKDMFAALASQMAQQAKAAQSKPPQSKASPQPTTPKPSTTSQSKPTPKKSNKK